MGQSIWGGIAQELVEKGEATVATTDGIVVKGEFLPPTDTLLWYSWRVYLHGEEQSSGWAYSPVVASHSCVTTMRQVAAAARGG